MSHILTIYSEKTPTVHLVLGLIVPFSEQFGTIVREKESGQVTGQDISWCDCVIMIRPYDIVCWDILKAAKQSGRFIIVYLDDDLLNVPDLYASLPRKIIAKLLKKRNQKALIGCLSLCDVLWGSNPLLLDRYQTYVSIGRCVKCDVITDFSKVGPIIERNKGGRILFAGATDHAALLNRYIIPALNQIADRFPDLEMTCIGVTKLQLCECKVAIKYIPWMNDYEQYRKVVEDERCDIGIAVIEKDEFYQCKYFNKFIEYSLLGAVGIYTDSAPYNFVVQHGKNGFLAKDTVESWAENISFAIKHPDLCKKCVFNARDFIMREFKRDKLVEIIHDNIPELCEYYSNKTEQVNYHTRVVWNILKNIGTKVIMTYETCIAKAGKNDNKN